MYGDYKYTNQRHQTETFQHFIQSLISTNCFWTKYTFIDNDLECLCRSEINSGRGGDIIISKFIAGHHQTMPKGYSEPHLHV